MAPLGTLNTIVTMTHPRTRKTLAAAKLGGVELNVIAAPGLDSGKPNRSPEYLAKFPLGKIPTFETESGFFLSESMAIPQYVAMKGSARQQLLGRTDEEEALNQQWIHFVAAHLQETCSAICLWRSGYGACDEAKEEQGNRDFKRWFNYMESHLRDRDWFVAESPSLADFAVADVMHTILTFYMDKEIRAEYPEVMRWYGSLVDLPALEGLYAGEWIEVRKKAPE